MKREWDSRSRSRRLCAYYKEDPHVIPFRPYGKRIMREWIQINVRGSEEYRQYQAVFEESIEHVLAQQEQVKS